MLSQQVTIGTVIIQFHIICCCCYPLGIFIFLFLRVIVQLQSSLFIISSHSRNCVPKVPLDHFFPAFWFPCLDVSCLLTQNQKQLAVYVAAAFYFSCIFHETCFSIPIPFSFFFFLTVRLSDLGAWASLHIHFIQVNISVIFLFEPREFVFISFLWKCGSVV